MDEEEKSRGYSVVVNDEGQHSIWASGDKLPAGWTRVGYEASRQACLDYIEAIWTDIRPRSLRARVATISAQAKEEAS